MESIYLTIALAPLAVLFSYLRRSAEAASQAQRRADAQRLETDRNQQAIMRQRIAQWPQTITIQLRAHQLPVGKNQRSRSIPGFVVL